MLCTCFLRLMLVVAFVVAAEEILQKNCIPYRGYVSAILNLQCSKKTSSLGKVEHHSGCLHL